MNVIVAFVRRHQVLSYYILTFAISWSLFLIVGGPGYFARAFWQTDPRFLPAVLAMLTGPAIAGLLLTGLLTGKAGLREIGSRLAKWRVAGRWYTIALLTAPVLTAVVLSVLSIASPIFLPPILTAEDKIALLLPVLGVGVSVLLEEVGWTGFSIPRLRLRHGVLATGLIVGALWGPWHLFQILWTAGTSNGEVPVALYVPLYFLCSVASLTAYRVLMVWVYDRTRSLLVATLMHASYAASTLPILSPSLSGTSFLIHASLLSAALWIGVAVVALTDHEHLTWHQLGLHPA
ncbi:membrane protease YdiL (CAAX protease family) [Arthrobacter oryzae]|uniref:CPBP family intramembrane glutamic endopeptidase n=1 Tax=Arthrobacter TaxID=1663 RepID=UPI0027810024|nr:CPBP family intramembrane glutamic endopeptidase [Arthrobacter oryzae]MDP9987572.1 membrane protease YdiL (CAAX protease family) [Arthrobacter oryzae]